MISRDNDISVTFLEFCFVLINNVQAVITLTGFDNSMLKILIEIFAESFETNSIFIDKNDALLQKK